MLDTVNNITVPSPESATRIIITHLRYTINGCPRFEQQGAYFGMAGLGSRLQWCSRALAEREDEGGKIRCGITQLSGGRAIIALLATTSVTSINAILMI